MAHVAGPKAQHLAICVRATSDVNGSLQGTYWAAAKRSFVTGSNGSTWRIAGHELNLPVKFR
jgi:hypothetical protein